MLSVRWQRAYGCADRAAETGVAPAAWRRLLAAQLADVVSTLSEMVDGARFAFEDRVSLHPDAADVLSQAYEPVVAESHTVVVERRGYADSARAVTLLPDPATPGMYFGTFPAGPDGDYLLRAEDHQVDISGTVEFVVAGEPLEDRDTAAKPRIAAGIAESSGGKVAAPAELAGLVDSLPAEDISKIVERELDLWDTPAIYLAIIALAGLEWFLRRRENLL